MINHKVYLGIDPGASGGITTLYPDGDVLSTKMLETETDIWEYIEAVAASGRQGAGIFATIEKVHAMPGNGVTGMFKFGMNYGLLRMALVGNRIPFDEVTPQHWQKKLLVNPRRKDSDSKTGESQTEFKNRLKQKAQQLFPKIKVTLAIADSLLISEYCRRKCEGRL